MAAQDEWGEGIVRIAAAHKAGEDYEAVARKHIRTLYAYGMTPVLFKPTLAAKMQFRSTFAGALSYFVATNGNAPEDKGFAIKGWTNTRFENVDIFTEGRVGEAMGNYFFTKPDGEEVKVEYSFGYILDDEGDVRINLHHSSLPYSPSPSITKDMIMAAQDEWGEGIVRIAAAHTAGEDYEQVARKHIKTRYENVDILIEGKVGSAMGNYFFTKPDGDEVKVEYSFGYFLDDEGDVRINLHHSSLPYSPAAP